MQSDQLTPEQIHILSPYLWLKSFQLVGRKWITGCLGRSTARKAHQQPHTQPYSIKLQLFLGPSQKSMLSEYISLMFTIGRQRYALSSIYSNRQPMTTHKPRWVQPACRDACHSLGMLRKPLIRKPRPKKLRKFMQAAKTVLLHALFWLSLAGPLKVNPLSGTIIRNVNLGERGCLVEHKWSLKKEIHWMEWDTVNIFTFCTSLKKIK